MRFLILFLLLLSSSAFASRGHVLNMSAVPYFLNGDRSFIPQKVLGSACSSFRSLSQEPVCNPAMLGEERDEDMDQLLSASVFFGDDYQTLYKNRDAIQADNKLALAQSLLSEKDPVEFEGAVNLWWRGEKFAIVYQPIRLTYFSMVKNQAYPDIVIHAMQEQSIAAQYGGFISKNWRAGLQLRLVDRKFVHEEFNLFDAIPKLDQYLQLKSQKLVLVEPGIAYEFHGDETLENWRPVLSANLTNLGFADKNYDEVPSRGVLDTGLSISPPLGFGDWELGLNYRWSSAVDGDKKFRLASQYRLGLVGFLAAIDPDAWSLGVISSFKTISAGLSYERRQSENLYGSSIYEDSGYVEFRFSL